MDQKKRLAEAYHQTAYPMSGHGKRNLQVLQEALQHRDGDLDSDLYGTGAVIEDFQNRMAAYLGKEAAVFFPSGTMAQQIAMRIWCDRIGVKRVAYHPLCHLEIHEEDGLKELHGIQSVLLADKERVVRPADVMDMQEQVACVLLELPQREIGGQLPEYEELEAISAHCQKNGIKLHLDGARLFEILPYYQKSAAEICQLFDSVYVSFYKGVGGVAGAILAGDKSFTAESVVWKRRHGGDLISLYPYIVSADYYFNRRRENFTRYYEEAKELAELYNQCHGITTRPLVPVSNMFHVHIPLKKEKTEELLLSLYEETGVGLIHAVHARGEEACYFEVSIGDRYAMIPKDEIRRAFSVLDQKMKAYLG